MIEIVYIARNAAMKKLSVTFHGIQSSPDQQTMTVGVTIWCKYPQVKYNFELMSTTFGKLIMYGLFQSQQLAVHVPF